MFFIRNNTKKFVIAFACVVVLVVLAVSAIKPKKSDHGRTSQNPTKAKYIVSLSKRLKSKGILLLLDGEGKMYVKKHFPGRDIISIVRKDNSYNFYSMRENKHWKLHKNTNFTSFSLMKKKYGKYDWENMAAWFATETEEDIIETMNIGGINGKYLSNIIYTYKGKRRETIIEEQNLAAAIKHKSHIYVQGYDSDNNKNFINAVNSKIGKKVKFRLKNSCAARGSRLLKLDNRIVTYGDNSGNAHKKNNMAAIAVINADKNRIVVEKQLKGKEVLLALVYGGRIKLIDYDGVLHEYDKNLKKIATRNISKKEIYTNNSSGEYIVEETNIIEKAKNIYVFRIHSDLDNKLIGYIDKYRKADLELLQSVKVSLPEEKDWVGENVSFYVNGD